MIEVPHTEYSTVMINRENCKWTWTVIGGGGGGGSGNPLLRDYLPDQKELESLTASKVIRNVNGEIWSVGTIRPQSPEYSRDVLLRRGPDVMWYRLDLERVFERVRLLPEDSRTRWKREAEAVRSVIIEDMKGFWK